jgi:GT2 family glycosyltransferase
MNLTIIIPNFNGKELLEKNLPKVIDAKQNKKNGIKEIIVVDDASTDESVKYLRENFARKIRIIVHKKNRGFANTINTGVRMAKGEFVCLLNSDVIPSNNFLAEISKDFSDEKVFGVSLHEKGFGYAKGKFSNGFIVHQGMPESNKVQESFWASGGSSVLRRDIFMELKGMDEELLSPFYWEDVDLCYRAQKRGYKILWEPRANVIHEHEATMKKLNQKYLQRVREKNYLLFNWKNLTSSNLMKKHKIALFRKMLRHPGYLRIFIMAISKWKILIERRKIEMRETNVSDEAVFEKFN